MVPGATFLLSRLGFLPLLSGVQYCRVPTHRLSHPADSTHQAPPTRPHSLDLVYHTLSIRPCPVDPTAQTLILQTPYFSALS